MSDSDYQQRLDLIDGEVQTLLQFCMSKGLSEKDIASCVNVFTTSTVADHRETTGRFSGFVVVMAILAAMGGVCYMYEPAYNQIGIHSRLALMKVLPYWDWSMLYDAECLVDNPFQKETNFTEEDCRACKETTIAGIDRIQDVKAVKIAKEYLFQLLPVIISDGLKGWPNTESFSLPNIVKLYKSHQDLQDLHNCTFHSSIENETNLYEFLEDYEENRLPTDRFYVTWENCNANSAKLLRRSYKRPYFLPHSTELSHYNQIHIGKGHLSADEYDLDSDEGWSDEMAGQGTWVAVISGSLLATLTPVEQCQSFGCNNVTVSIKAGEALAVPSKLYLHDWLPNSDNVTVAISSSIFWFE